VGSQIMAASLLVVSMKDLACFCFFLSVSGQLANLNESCPPCSSHMLHEAGSNVRRLPTPKLQDLACSICERFGMFLFSVFGQFD
jgi:hypothetical protein